MSDHTYAYGDEIEVHHFGSTWVRRRFLAWVLDGQS